jgi:diguanylate cyclase (GGDEF)-like protein
MLDVDHFKKFNDTYGHDLGDQVLRMVASKLSKVAGGGKAYRYGGEEFCVIYPGKDMKASFPYLSSLRQTVDETRMVIRGKDRPKQKPDIMSKRRRPIQEVHVTISIGVAEKCNELYTPEDVIKAADKALYVAKEKGRNRISQYGLKLSEIPISI